MLDSAFFLGLIGNIIIACAIVAIGLLTQFIRKRTMLNVENMIALSVGLILAIVFLGFLPEIISLNSIPPIIIGFWILIGVFLFYSLELFLHWHHCKDIGEQDSHEHEHENNSLIMVGTFLHNFLHGVILFSAFSLSISVGVATTIAILFHAIPQNIANLLMNHKNPVFAYIAAFGGIVGAIFVFPLYDFLTLYQPQIIATIGGGLLYTAMSDMLPGVKEKGDTSHKIWYLIWMICGVGLFYGVSEFTHWFEEHTGTEIHDSSLEDDTHEDDEGMEKDY